MTRSVLEHDDKQRKSAADQMVRSENKIFCRKENQAILGAVGYRALYTFPNRYKRKRREESQSRKARYTQFDALIEVLERFLGFTKMHKAFLFGVGSLGGALLRDSGLHHFGLEIVGAFDINPGLVGKEINGIPIYHSDEFEIKMKSCDVNIGVLTVPINIAQEITDKMIAGGIKAVWNFTPFRIRVPENIVVQNTSLYAHLAVMFNRLNVIQE